MLAPNKHPPCEATGLRWRLHALVEQAIGHLANAWSLRR
jgi:hypothetical protein